MKRILIVVLLLLVVGGVAVYLTRTQNPNSTLSSDLSDFSIQDTSSVTKVFLADKAGNTILLERQEEGFWSLNEKYEARTDYLVELLKTMKKLKVKSPVSKSAYNNILKNMAGNSTKVEVFQGGNTPSKVYYVGSANQSHSGTYMLLEGAKVPFLMHIPGFKGYLGPKYSTSENEWRNKAIFRYGRGTIASVKVEHLKAPEKSFEIALREDNTIGLTALISGQQINNVDTAAALAYLTAYKKVYFESFEETKDNQFIDSVALSDPEIVYTVTDREGNSKTVKTFLKPAKNDATDMEGNPIDHDLDRLYALVNDKQFVVIQYHVFDNLAYSLNNFIKS
ncbi:MAG: DUF4340 domain-containing protein [Salibacteraceae bacterium]